MVNKLGNTLTDPIETWLYEKHLERKKLFEKGIISLVTEEDDTSFLFLKVNDRPIQAFYKPIKNSTRISDAIYTACETIRSLNYDNR